MMWKLLRCLVFLVLIVADFTLESTVPPETVTDCSSTPTATTPESSSTTPEPSTTTTEPCVDDVASNCWSRPDSDCEGLYESWARVHCPLRCGYCPGADTQCVDKQDRCDRFGNDLCTSGSFRVWARENCRRYCSFCTDTESSEPHCELEERKFAEHDWLRVDCDTFCFCQDAAGSQYSCHDRCPTYPENCTMLPYREDVCCSQPQGNEPGCEPVAVFNTPTPCQYKENQYQDGETWEDGCEYHCLCTRGTSLCANKCVDEDLAANCHVEAASPGTCCPAHVCPQDTPVG